MVKLYQCWKRIKGRTKQNKKLKDVMRKQSHDPHESAQIKKNHITNGRIVEKTNDPKTLLNHWMNTRILTHKVNSQAKISESMSNDGMKKGVI